MAVLHCHTGPWQQRLGASMEDGENVHNCGRLKLPSPIKQKRALYMVVKTIPTRYEGWCDATTATRVLLLSSPRLDCHRPAHINYRSMGNYFILQLNVCVLRVC